MMLGRVELYFKDQDGEGRWRARGNWIVTEMGGAIIFIG
jgi:hypothetical protein